MCELTDSKLLLDSLINAPLLVRELGGFSHLDRSFLNQGELDEPLDFQQKLGHLYEDALERLLQSSNEVSNLHRGVQVFTDGGRTIGEFDYLFQYRGEIIHLELAVKFYCAVRLSGELKWYGPDARDHWQRKHERMRSHQFQIAQTEEGRSVIERLFGNGQSQVDYVDRVVTKHLIYGKLFDGVGTEREEAVDTCWNASRGKWLWRSELYEYIQSDQLWVIPKFMWPCQLSQRLLDGLEHVDREGLFVLSEERAVMFTDGEAFFFLVHDDWLEHAS